MKTFYDVLELPPTATTQDITRAYRKAAMRWHPDRNQGNEAEATLKFKELADAREILTDAKRRVEYDKSLTTLRQERAAPKHEEVVDPQVQQERWAAIAASVSKLGLGRDTVIGSLMSKGCPPDLARDLADKAMTARSSAMSQRPVGNDAEAEDLDLKAARRKRQILIACAVAALVVVVGAWLFPWASVLGIGPSIASPQDGSNVVAQSGSQEAPVAISAQPTADWRGALPPEVTGFDEKSGFGQIRYSALPDGKNFDALRKRIASPFDLKLLQTVPMPNDEQLMLFASAPADFTCHDCHVILSAMLLHGSVAEGFRTLVPLRPLMTAGASGKLSLQGDRRASILAVSPTRDGFAFKDGDTTRGNTVEWKNLFAIEPGNIRLLGSYPLHSDNMDNGVCAEPRTSPCTLKDTRVQFSRQAGPAGYFDILASEIEVDASASRSGSVARDYTLRFDGNSYVRLP